MRLVIMAATSTAKVINKARLTGKLSLVAVGKLNILSYFVDFTKKQLDSGKEEYRDKYNTLVKNFNSLINACPDYICNIRESDCSTSQYESTINVNNPYNPQAPEEVIVDPVVDTHIADIDDITIYPDYNVTTVLSVALFDAKYTDSDAHGYDAIRIDDIHSTNLGVFYVSGLPIVEGQVILRTQIINNEFTHIGSDTGTIISDSFLFSARDAVTGEWVQ